MEFGIKQGMIFLVKNRKTGNIVESAFLGHSPTGKYVKYLAIGNPVANWMKKDEFDRDYELVEFLSY